MSCPTDTYGIEPGVRLRPVPELGACLAYTPARPALHRLNASTWMVASLCDGRSLKAINAGYQEANPSGTDNETTVARGLEQLVSCGIVRRMNADGA